MSTKNKARFATYTEEKEKELGKKATALLIIKHLLRVFSSNITKYYIRSKYSTRPSVSWNITNSCNIL